MHIKRFLITIFCIICFYLFCEYEYETLLNTKVVAFCVSNEINQTEYYDFKHCTDIDISKAIYISKNDNIIKIPNDCCKPGSTYLIKPNWKYFDYIKGTSKLLSIIQIIRILFNICFICILIILSLCLFILLICSITEWIFTKSRYKTPISAMILYIFTSADKKDSRKNFMNKHSYLFYKNEK